MIARRSVWSDPRVQELAAAFVPAADEVWRLHHRDGPECDLFRIIAEQGHYAGRTVPTDTRQGIYATTTSGVLLSSVNTRDPRRVAAMLETALARWDAMPETERYRDRDEFDAKTPVAQRQEERCPTDGMVLRVSSRDLPRAASDERDGRRGRRSWKRLAWNQDYAWFGASEILRFMPTKLEVGATAAVPARISRRLARLHLIDNVRGQVAAFADADIEHIALRTRITAVHADRIEIAIEGQSRVVSAGRPVPAGIEGDRVYRSNPEHAERGIETTILGRAKWDRATDRFTKFDLVALGSRWGGTTFNGREHDRGPADVGFAFTLASDDAPVAPAYLWQYGW